MKLKDWLKERGMFKAEFARRVGVSRKTVNNWISQSVRPTYDHYIKVKEITDDKVKYEEIFKA